MAVNRDPILKKCRSLDLDPAYLGIYKNSNRKPKRTRGKKSEYGLQLREKQKAKFIYGVLEKQFRSYYEKADRKQGMTGTNLMVLLESRLDSVIFRLGFARTRRESRQVVTHGHVLVNGKRVNIPSYQVKVGDVIEVTEKTKESAMFNAVLEATAGRVVSKWLDLNKQTGKATVVAVPEREDIDVPVDEILIVEYYSK
ncbi:MAG: 30S ribosomal protein S4 [Clostridia bacterium]|nr:30S ribosomal protein S4 [Clostridia bacterium]